MLQNDKYDEAIEVSQSIDQGSTFSPKVSKGHSAKPQGRNEGKQQEESKNRSIKDKPFDEALEFSHSGSDESIDTVTKREKKSSDTHGSRIQAGNGKPIVESFPSSMKPGGPGAQGKEAMPTIQPVSTNACCLIDFCCC